jgi:hypothetical protein
MTTIVREYEFRTQQQGVVYLFRSYRNFGRRKDFLYGDKRRYTINERPQRGISKIRLIGKQIKPSSIIAPPFPT